MTTTRPIADELNKVLSENGEIHVCTVYRVTVYSKRHAGWFTEGADGNLYVQNGKGRNCLSHGDCLLVRIRIGRRVSL